MCIYRYICVDIYTVYVYIYMLKIGIFMYLDVMNKLSMKLYGHVLQSGKS